MEPKANVSGWHKGELEVQRLAHVGEVSPGGIKTSIPHGAGVFLENQRFAGFASTAADGSVWASVRVGDLGLFNVIDPVTVETLALGLPGDPLIENLRARPQVGVVIFDPANRRRMRLNGVAEVLADDRLRIHARQVYGNCPQYIQEREWSGKPENAGGALRSSGSRLTVEQQRRIAAADTLFIASAHPESGADASHRGGNPGFIRVDSDAHLIIPDYSGNKMFNTLGNIAVNPRAGLVFPDFERGRTLQLSGRANIIWDVDMEQFPGAQRLLDFDVEQVIELDYPALRGYVFQSYSPFNPPLETKNK